MITCGYGTYLPPADGSFSYEDLVQEVKLVESVALDGVFFTEHHGMSGWFPNPLATAIFFLCATSRLRAGCAPLLLPLHNPVRVAEDAAFADRISGGRLVVGVGAGFLPADFEPIGVPVNERAKRFEEGLRIIKLAWSGEPAEHRGPYYQFVQPGPLVPMPLSSPGPPLWIAAGTPWGFRNAARYGDALFMDSVRAPEEIPSVVDLYREACKEYGRAPRVVLARRVWIGERAETEAYLDAFEQEMRRYLDLTAAGNAPPTRPLRERGADSASLRARAVAGTVPEVAERLAAIAEMTGADYFVLRLRWQAAKTAEALFRVIERAGEVAALLRA